jgi:hypothetical protein
MLQFLIIKKKKKYKNYIYKETKLLKNVMKPDLKQNCFHRYMYIMLSSAKCN